MADEMYTFDNGEGRAAVLGLQFKVPKSEWETFFARIKVFAERNGFKYRVKQIKPGADMIFVDLWKQDIAIGGGNVFEPDEFVLAFYIDPAKGGTPQSAKAAAEAMQTLTADVPGVTVTPR